MKVRKVMTYEVWTLDDRSMSFEEVERIIEEEQERIEKLWSCIDSSALKMKHTNSQKVSMKQYFH